MSSGNKRKRQKVERIKNTAARKAGIWREGRAERRKLAEKAKAAHEFNNRLASFRAVHKLPTGAQVKFLSEHTAVVTQMNKPPYYVNMATGNVAPGFVG